MKFTFIITATVFLIAQTASGAFYRCTENGKTIISNVPCGGHEIITRDLGFISSDKQPESQSTRKYENIEPETRSKPEPRKRKLRTEDFDINHHVTERNGVIEISGRITGPKCKSLRIDAWARSSTGGIVSCTTVESITGNSTTFRCSDSYYRSNHGKRRDWFVSSFYANCQD